MYDHNFSISAPGTLQLTPGQVVDFNTPLVRTVAKTGFQIHIAQELGIPNDKIFMHMSKIVGDTVKQMKFLQYENQPLELKISSPKSGIIKQIDRDRLPLYIKP